MSRIRGIYHDVSELISIYVYACICVYVCMSVYLSSLLGKISQCKLGLPIVFRLFASFFFLVGDPKKLTERSSFCWKHLQTWSDHDTQVHRGYRVKCLQEYRPWTKYWGHTPNRIHLGTEMTESGKRIRNRDVPKDSIRVSSYRRALCHEDGNSL